MAAPRKPRRAKPKSVEEIAKEKPVGTRAKAVGKRKPTTRVSPTARLVQRSQQIVLDRDRDWMSWTEIAAKHKIHERTARQNYQDYVEGIAPLIASELPMDIGHEALRKLHGVQRRIARMVDTTKNDAVKLGALNSLARVLQQEVELRQHLSLLPKNLGDVHVIADQLWAAEQIVAVLREMNAPPDAFRRVADVLRGSPHAAAMN